MHGRKQFPTCRIDATEPCQINPQLDTWRRSDDGVP
jgi:hypothetical protein